LHFTPSFFASFMYDYIKQIELNWNADVNMIFENICTKKWINIDMNKIMNKIIKSILK
jgi:hypothetical protein